MEYSSYVEKLESHFSDEPIAVTIRKTPSYINRFFPGLENEDIILITKKALSYPYNSEPVRKEHSTLSDFEVTGQPLEAPYLDDSLDISASFASLADHHINCDSPPLDLRLSRSCLGYCNLVLKPSLSVWVLMDGKDVDRTVLLSCDVSGDWLKRRWVLQKGCIQDIPPLDELQAIHIGLTNLPNPIVNCRITCSNEIVNHDNPVESYFSCDLHFSWSKLTATPPLNHKSTVIKAITKYKIGYSTGVSQFFWEQLVLLHSLLTVIKNHQPYSSSPVVLPNSKPVLDFIGETHDTKPQRRISALIKEPFRGDVTNTDNMPSLRSILPLFLSPTRSGMDLLDRLWYLFIECTSRQEMSECLKQVSEEFKKAGVPFYSLASNISRLAAARFGGDVRTSNLDPLECLVELGIETLRKQVLLIFTKAHLATSKNLNISHLPKFSDSNLSSWDLVAEQWILWLGQIHCVLEFLCHTQDTLSIKMPDLYSFSTCALEKFTGKKSEIKQMEHLIMNPTLELTFPLAQQMLDSKLTKMQFEWWSLVLTTSNDNRRVSSVFTRSYECPFKFLLPEIDKNVTGNTSLGILSEQQTNFYWTEAHSVEDKNFFKFSPK